MAEINKITDYIINEAREKCNEIIKEAERQRDAIIKEAEEQGQKEYNAIINSAQEKALSIEQVSVSNANHKVSEIVLQTKIQGINKTLEMAREQILNSGDEEYNSFILSLLNKYAKNYEKVTLLFNSKDSQRLNEKVKEFISSKGFVLAQDDKISGGFIIRDGKVDENCTIDALFDLMEDKLSDKISSELFG